MELKVGLFNDSFPPTIDGVANTVFNYANIITQKFGKVVVATPEYPHVVDDYPFNVHRYSSINFRGKMPYRVGNPFSPLTINELKKQNMDIMHVHCPFASSVLARQVNNSYIKKNRKPIVFTYHTKFDVDLDKYVHNKKFKKLAHNFVLNNIRSADEVWVVSNGAGESVRNFGYQGDYLVMPNGTDFPKGKADQGLTEEIKRMYRILDNQLVFLFVGRMMWYKNVKLILDTLNELKKAGVNFKAFMLGDGTDRPAIYHYSKSIGIDDCTVFTGAVYDREKVRAFFSISDLLLFPSTYDTNGLVVREAAACDCASLLIRGSCAAEGVEDGVSGILAEENPEDCAKKILELVRADAFEKLGKAAGEKVYFSWERSVEMAYKRYEEILKNKYR